MKKIISISLLVCLLLWSQPLFAATDYFADPAGSGTTCSEGSPCTLVYATMTKASSGDTVKANNGAYGLSATLDIPLGVNVTATNQTSPQSCNVRIYPTTNLNVSNPLVRFSSASPGTNGNQIFSYIELDGIDGANSAALGVEVKNRNNVTIDYCDIHDFTGNSNWWPNGSQGVWVWSSEDTPTAIWTTYWPADPGEPGDDSSISSLWPLNPVDTFTLSHSYITNCGDADGDSFSPAIGLWDLKDSSFHDLVIDVSSSETEAIMGTAALLENVDIYNTTITGVDVSTGVLGTWRSSYMIELWNLRNGCEIYNNTLTNGSMSIAYGKQTSIHDNVITYDTDITGSISGGNIGIEITLQSYSLVEDNFVSGSKYGVVCGHSIHQDSKSFLTKYNIIRKNVFYNILWDIIFVEGESDNLVNVPATSDIEVYNNTCNINRHSVYAGIAVRESGLGTLSDVNVINNIVSGVLGYAGVKSGTVTNLTVDHSDLYNNGTDDWAGVTDTNTITGNPSYTDSTFDTYSDATPQANSVIIDEGTHNTTTANSGSSSTTLSLTDMCFWPGDYVYIVGDGSPANALVRLSSDWTDWDYSAKTVELTAADSWDSGAKVYLAYSSTIGLIGDEMDMGAIEYELVIFGLNISDGDQGVSTTPTITWDYANPPVQSAYVWWDVGTCAATTDCDGVADSVADTDFSYAPGTLTHSTQYCFGIKAFDGTNYGDCQEYDLITVSQQNPPTPSGISPYYHKTGAQMYYHKSGAPLQ